MGRFEFRKHEIELDIAGVKVAVSDSSEFVKKLEETGNRMVDFGNSMNDNDDLEAAKYFMLDILDELLGEEAMDKIEAEHELDLYDCFDLFKYITDEVKKYHNERAETYQQKRNIPAHVPLGTQAPVTMAQAAVENRAARRARQRAGRRKK